MAVLKLAPDTIAPLHFARETYIKKLLAYGLEPVFVSPLFPKALVDRAYADANGVLCMGGTDIDPRNYGAEAHPSTEAGEPLRDELELYIAKKAIADKKPFLGICRGCQVLAVAAGGSLEQHVPDVAPNEAHGVGEGGTYDTIRTQERHGTRIAHGSKAFKLLGAAVPMPSGHHQAVKDPGDEMLVTGVSPAGIVEIIEHRDPSYFCFGIQGHPEVEAGPLEPVFKAFAEACAGKPWTLDEAHSIR